MTPLMSRKLEISGESPTPILVPRKINSNSLYPPENLHPGPARRNTSVPLPREDNNSDLAAIKEEI